MKILEIPSKSKIEKIFIINLKDKIHLLINSIG